MTPLPPSRFQSARLVSDLLCIQARKAVFGSFPKRARWVSQKQAVCVQCLENSESPSGNFKFKIRQSRQTLYLIIAPFGRLWKRQLLKWQIDREFDPSLGQRQKISLAVKAIVWQPAQQLPSSFTASLNIDCRLSREDTALITS